MESAVKDLLGIFALSSGVCAHLLTKEHLDIKDPWYGNRYFWAGLIGNLPALIAIVAHIFMTGKTEDVNSTP